MLSVESHAAGQAAAAHWPVAVKKQLPPLTVGLVTHAQDDFGGAVVAGHHVGRHEEASGGRPGQTEVQDLQRAVGLHHNVTGLQVLEEESQVALGVHGMVIETLTGRFPVG